MEKDMRGDNVVYILGPVPFWKKSTAFQENSYFPD